MPPEVPHPCRLFLFDLDGTLIDSKADIAQAVNLALARMRLPAISEARIAEFVGDGVHKLMQRALREATGEESAGIAVTAAVDVLMVEYGNHLLDSTRLYPPVMEILDSLWWGIFGVVSNKPEVLSRRILKGLGLADRLCVILGGDSLPKQKPDPAPLFRAMELCGASSSLTAMIGDGPADIYAGKAAGLVTCGVLGGFGQREDLVDAGCDFLIDDLSELPGLFCAPEAGSQ